MIFNLTSIIKNVINAFMKKIIIVILVLISYNLAFAEYHWNKVNDNLILGTALLGSSLTVLYDKNDSIAYEPEKLNFKINSIDKTATDNWSPGSAKISDILLLTQFTLPFSLLLNDKLDNQKEEIALIYLQSVSVNTLFTFFTKSKVKRYRPYVYNQKISQLIKTNKDSQSSFFSGHTSTSFTASVFMIKVIHDNHLYENDKEWIYTALLSGSALTAYLRYDSGKHFPSDIITGAIVGSVCGLIIPELHKQEANTSGNRLLRFQYSF